MSTGSFFSSWLKLGGVHIMFIWLAILDAFLKYYISKNLRRRVSTASTQIIAHKQHRTDTQNHSFRLSIPSNRYEYTFYFQAFSINGRIHASRRQNTGKFLTSASVFSRSFHGTDYSETPNVRRTLIGYYWTNQNRLLCPVL